ncbi:MAG: UDP-N-acetylmuramoyl-tripeptide--D-alanyl-D-alanine ligase [Bacteroidales bacterium]|nr:UDP-N-acetylmuramoyl-tripeptide--D-alanyl-D-alanine ligase [Bacteroidales bacterium]
MELQELYKIYLSCQKVSTDTRNLPEGCIFFALHGEKFDGNAFAEQALLQGAAYVVIDNEEYYKPGGRYILVTDTLTALQELARYHRYQLKIPVIGITGSNGKTTTKELIARVLAQRFKTYSTQGNLNNHIGVPLTILSIDSSYEMAVVEMGANHIGEIDALCRIAIPDYGIITNIGKAHLEGFGSFEGVIKAKTELYRFVDARGGTIFFSHDNQLLIEQIKKLQCRTISYGASSHADIKGICNTDSASPFLTFTFFDAQGNNYTVKTSLFGNYNFENAMAAVAIGQYFGVDNLKIVQAIESYMPQNNRSQLVEHETNRIICDYYNANPTSMENAITNFALLPVENFSKVLILGEMKELGDETANEHHKVVKLTETGPFDKVFLVGKPYQTAKSSKAIYFDNNADLIEFLRSNKITNSYVLIKGSRGARLEEVYRAVFCD